MYLWDASVPGLQLAYLDYLAGESWLVFYKVKGHMLWHSIKKGVGNQVAAMRVAVV
jgi:hypothetical protein